jgi:hypothetical protein
MKFTEKPLTADQKESSLKGGQQRYQGSEEGR